MSDLDGDDASKFAFFNCSVVHPGEVPDANRRDETLVSKAGKREWHYDDEELDDKRLFGVLDGMRQNYGRVCKEQVPCPLRRCKKFTMRWQLDTSSGWVEFLGAIGENAPYVVHRKLLLVSGRNEQEDKNALAELERYAEPKYFEKRPVAINIRFPQAENQTKPESQKKLEKSMFDELDEFMFFVAAVFLPAF